MCRIQKIAEGFDGTETNYLNNRNEDAEREKP